MEHLAFYNTNLTEINNKVRKNKLNSKEYLYNPTIKQRVQLYFDIIYTNTLLFQYKLLYDIPWNIQFFKTKYKIENNYPHTHNNTIYFPSSFFDMEQSKRINLLIHEKIHIYQRYHTIPFHKMLFEQFNLKVKQLVTTHEDYQKVRQNPDLNKLIYTDDGEYTLTIFNDNPKSLSDNTTRYYNKHNKVTKYSQLKQNEHPYETLAYYITSSIINKTLDNNLKKYLN